MDEEVVRQRFWPVGEDAEGRLLEVRSEDAQAADQHGHLGGGERQQLRAFDQQCFRGPRLFLAEEVAETVRPRLEHGERLDVGLLLRGIRAPGCERHRDFATGVLRRLLHRRTAAENDEIGERDLHAAGVSGVPLALDLLERGESLGERDRFVDLPVLLRGQAEAGAVGAAALVGAAEGRSGSPGGRDQLRERQAGGEEPVLEGGDLRLADERVRHPGDGILEQQLLGRNQCAEVARDRPHVAMGELEPGAGEGVGELLRVGEEVARDRLVDRIHAQRQVGRQHHRRVALRRIVRIGHGGRRGRVGRHPLERSGGALGQIPLVAEEGLEEAVVPGLRRGCPGAFEAAADGVAAAAGAEVVAPAETHLLERRRFGLGADVTDRYRRTVRLAEGVSAGDERHRLLVVHRHAAKGLADVLRRGERAGHAVGAFRIDVDETHLHRCERIGELTVAGVALVLEPGVLGSPIDLFRLPDVLATAGEAEGLEPHRLEGAVAGEDHQVGPRDLAAVLLLHRPEQPARLVEVDVVRPAVERCEALLAGACAAAAVVDPVGAGAVPRHADEERAVVAVVGGPPVLRGRHHRFDVLLQGGEIEGLELRGVVELRAHGIGLRRVAVEDRKVQLIRPPVAIRLRPLGRAGERALALAFHDVLSFSCSRVVGQGIPQGSGRSCGGETLGRAQWSTPDADARVESRRNFRSRSRAPTVVTRLAAIQPQIRRKTTLLGSLRLCSTPVTAGRMCRGAAHSCSRVQAARGGQ